MVAEKKRKVKKEESWGRALVEALAIVSASLIFYQALLMLDTLI